MAFRSNSYTGLCSASDDVKGKPSHTASVEHIDFRKAFDFADKCAREGSKSAEKLSAFKPVYVRRPIQALHSFDSLNAGPEPVMETAKLQSGPALSKPAVKKTEQHLEGAAGELQRVFDQLAAQLEHEANELRKEAREASPESKRGYLNRANSDSGSSAERRISGQETDPSLSIKECFSSASERRIRSSNSFDNTPATSLKPPPSRASVSPVHTKRSHFVEGRRGSAGECGSSSWNKPPYSGKASSSHSPSPVRERFVARRRADSLDRVRDGAIASSKSGDGERSVVTQRITHWEGARDTGAPVVSQRKSAVERKRDVDVSVFSNRRSSLDREVDSSIVLRRRSSFEQNADGNAVPSHGRSSSRDRAEARLAALQKLSANREKFEDYVPRSHRNGKLTIKDALNSEEPHSLHIKEQGVSGTESQFINKGNITPDRNDRSPIRDSFNSGELYRSSTRGQSTEISNRVEKAGEVSLKKRFPQNETSLDNDSHSSKDSFLKSEWRRSPEVVDSCTAVSIELPPSGISQLCSNNLKLEIGDEGRPQEQLFRPIRQDSDYDIHHLTINTDQDSSISDYNLSPGNVHSNTKRLHVQLNSPSVQSSSDEPASIPDEIQTAASVHSQSLSSSTESLASSDAAAAADLDFPQVLDKVVSRYEMERKSEQDRAGSRSPVKDNNASLCVDVKSVSNSAENIHRIQKVKICNFFSDENLSHKKDSTSSRSGIGAESASESRKESFVNPEMPGYVGFANLPNQVHRKSVKKGFEFTLMVVGESGLGKSTLVNSLFMTDLYPERNVPAAAERIHKTVSIEASSVEIEERGVKLRLTVVDTPGYGDAVNSTDCFKSIIKYVDDQFENYFSDESGIDRKNIVDNRIHACFYFINPAGHGLKPLDVVFMRALHHKVNIVPVIAKADTLTKPELARLKKKIMDEIEENDIHIYSLPDCDSDEDESYKESCRELKAAVPFAVVGSNQVMDVRGHKVRARVYPWGVVEVENPEHCDFIKLRTMFITHMQDLQEVTQDVHYEKYRKKCIMSGYPEIAASHEVDIPLSEKNRLLQQKDMELRLVREELLRVQEQIKKQQQMSMSSGNVAEKKTVNSSMSSNVARGGNPRQDMPPAMNGQANGKMAKKAPIVQMNQV